MNDFVSFGSSRPIRFHTNAINEGFDSFDWEKNPIIRPKVGFKMNQESQVLTHSTSEILYLNIMSTFSFSSNLKRNIRGKFELTYPLSDLFLADVTFSDGFSETIWERSFILKCYCIEELEDCWKIVLRRNLLIFWHFSIGKNKWTQ